MTDLFSAYGMDESPMHQQQQQQQQMPSFPPSPEMTQQGRPVKQMVSIQQPTEVAYQPPAAMYTNQQEGAPKHYIPTESFWDRISLKRYEVLKVFVLSLIVLLALSMDHVFNHYLGQYLSNSLLTTIQEMLVRVSYPVAIVLIIWLIKAL